MKILNNNLHCIHFNSSLDKGYTLGKTTVNNSHETIQSNHFKSVIKPNILSKKEDDKQRALSNVQSATKLSGQSLGETVDSLVETIGAGYPTKNFRSKFINEWKGDYIIGYGKWGGDTNNFESLLKPEEKHQDKKDFIKYGALSFRPHEGFKAYGNGAIYFYDNVKENMTFTPGDSLRLYKELRPGNYKGYPFAVEGNLYPIIANMNLNYASRESVLNWSNAFGNFQGGDTVEWQYHGPLPFDDIEYICFASKTPEDELYQVKKVFSNFVRE